MGLIVFVIIAIVHRKEALTFRWQPTRDTWVAVGALLLMATVGWGYCPGCSAHSKPQADVHREERADGQGPIKHAKAEGSQCEFPGQ